MSGKHAAARRTAVAGLALALLGAPGMTPSAWAAAGDVATFGGDSFGQLGNGAEGSHFDPQVELSGASDVAGGREHALALIDGTVHAWGSDAKGQVGNGSPLANVLSPVPVPLPSAATAVTTGHYHSLALRTDGAVSAWGWNSKGQMGPNGGTRTTVAAPVTVTLPGAASQVAAGRAHSLALVGGSVYSWGDNSFGQLGYGTFDTDRHSTPTLVRTLPPIAFLAGGRDSTYAISTGGDLYAWGANQYGQVGNGSSGSGAKVLTPTRVLTGALQVEAGADHTIAVTTSGSTYTWGRNRFGQLGYAGSTNRTRPQRVSALPAVAKAYAGRDHNIAIASSGAVYTWGRNDGGQLGRNPSTVLQSSTPTQVAGLDGASDAGGGQVYSVVLQ
jgi:alpha-tubulin suppressor-like RCC1 family protein